MSIIPSVTSQMRTILTTVAEQAAAEHNLIQRRGKVTGANLAQTLVFGWWHNPKATLEELSQVGHACGLMVTPQALDQRWNARTANFLQAILQACVLKRISGQQVESTLLQRFERIVIEDSSIVTLPATLSDRWRGCGGDGGQSSVKLQTGLEMLHGCLDGPHLVAGHIHDRKASQAHQQPVGAGCLRLVDLGYWSLTDWEEANQVGSQWLSRMKSNVRIWHNSKQWTLSAWCLACSSDRFDASVSLGQKQRVPARMLGVRVCAKTAQERRRKLKRASQKRGQVVSSERLALCDWTVIVTNLPSDQLTADEAFVLFGYRWQIELLFKLWKSEGYIDEWRTANPWRCLCELYAKLIAMVMQQWVFAATIWQFPDRSWVKAARTVRSHVLSLAMVFVESHDLQHMLYTLAKILSQGCRINKSRTKRTTHQKLASPVGRLA